MKDANFLKANNARSIWHPMTAPADALVPDTQPVQLVQPAPPRGAVFRFALA